MQDDVVLGILCLENKIIVWYGHGLNNIDHKSTEPEPDIRLIYNYIFLYNRHMHQQKCLYVITLSARNSN